MISYAKCKKIDESAVNQPRLTLTQIEQHKNIVAVTRENIPKEAIARQQLLNLIYQIICNSNEMKIMVFL